MSKITNDGFIRSGTMGAKWLTFPTNPKSCLRRWSCLSDVSCLHTIRYARGV